LAIDAWGLADEGQDQEPSAVDMGSEVSAGLGRVLQDEKAQRGETLREG